MFCQRMFLDRGFPRVVPSGYMVKKCQLTDVSLSETAAASPLNCFRMPPLHDQGHPQLSPASLAQRDVHREVTQVDGGSTPDGAPFSFFGGYSQTTSQASPWYCWRIHHGDA